MVFMLLTGLKDLISTIIEKSIFLGCSANYLTDIANSIKLDAK